MWIYVYVYVCVRSSSSVSTCTTLKSKASHPHASAFPVHPPLVATLFNICSCFISFLRSYTFRCATTLMMTTFAFSSVLLLSRWFQNILLYFSTFVVVLIRLFGVHQIMLLKWAKSIYCRTFLLSSYFALNFRCANCDSFVVLCDSHRLLTAVLPDAHYCLMR